MRLPVIGLATLFQLVTLGLYYMGPITYSKDEPSVFVFFWVGAYIVLLNVGYFFGRSIYLKGRSWTGDSIPFLKRAILVVFLMMPFVFLARVGDVFSSMSLGKIYTASHGARAESGNIVEYIRMLLAIFFFGLFPVLVFYWQNIPKKIRLLSLFGVLGNIGISIFMGINKEIFNHLILLTVFLLLRNRGKLILSKKNIFRAFFLGALFFFAASYFVSTQLTRDGAFAVTGVNSALGYYSEYNESDGQVLVFYSALSSYLTQGYYAFDMALELPFEFTKGVGNSTFLSRQIDRIFGSNIADDTYPARLEEKGWDRYVKWSTFYLWWASDIHFIGVAVLMFFIGLTFRILENTLVKQKDDVCACICYGYYALMLFYLSANNQIFQAGEGFVGFLMVFIPLFLVRRYSIMS